MIETRSLTKVYKNGNNALKDISLDIGSGITSVIGRNGAGKTTMMRIFSTQLRPTSGSVTINGYDVVKESNKVRKIICSIPQEASPIGVLTPLEQVKMYLVARGLSISSADREARIALSSVGLEESMKAPADTLSGGMKRKVFVAMALSANADIVFLDEPTTGLDPMSRLEVWSLIRNLRSDIVLTTHYMEEAASLSKYIIMVDHGTVIKEGTLKELLSEFDGLIRVESRQPLPDSSPVGGIYIKYVNASEANEYISMGCDVKNITLDDVFIKERIYLEP
ncbi:ABC transport system ATP-binding protein [Thermoplasma volcanium GSS1]|uniref:ABC transport system ATP-binding protein n=1 Tax=Thermoplasma volcanium (strain ATCC 51530 / DSM 4299 / JCM 9571 / NBRC 15438 / GSS1) TaxID=273116 RepID=Q97BC9_THEVO|nr:ATP-binding cassette domain-containing protein [Thermoplasma volcanium]BAB59669.1 ABC transport system ATP-binding protein [Thermoplasma volcanium GSS1]